ncbi:MAG: antibiotic biosynthesis monooxygenase [Rhodobacteraceae bacterium]|uniref:putative quinol monooxygenase n=1 Tax=Marivita sp. TaxID=2003365 RepID=UPI003B52CF6F|nr:antibiotic biosynthesis monooxygenase [Paracoccaceae bacterium]
MADSQDRKDVGVRLSGRLVCASEQEAQIVCRHLPEHIDLTRAEPGCISFDVSPTEDPLIWTVEEHFQDRDSFGSHQERTQASAWGSATAKITRDYKITELD